MTPIEQGLSFILSLFQEPIWPRAISTKALECRQISVNNSEEALTRFRQSNYLDCRISAYSPNADKNPSVIASFQGIGTATPEYIVLMIDLDRGNFRSERAFHLAFSTTLKTIKEKLGLSNPTVIWSGRGYHIIQPLDANGVILENIKEFENIQQVSVKFLRFAEWFLSNGKFLSKGKSDPIHNNTVSFGNMMLRIPGSINSKNGQPVRVIHQWDGYKPPINCLLRDFRHWLIEQTLQERKHHGERKQGNLSTNRQVINWIENLLQTPIKDYRKFALWRILAPYLLNVKHLSYEQSFSVMQEWLTKCDAAERLNFNRNLKIKEALRGARGYFPISLDNLKKEHVEIYKMVVFRR